MSNRTSTLRLTIAHLQGRRASISTSLATAKSSALSASASASATDLARSLLQRAALLTQSQLRYHITALGSMAMEAVFPEPIALELEFRENRGKTEAKLAFKRPSGLSTDPMDGDSGGACNIAGLGLRVSMREVQRPKTRPVIIMDEPGGSINDASREMHRKFAEVMGEVGEKLGVQFLIVTMIQELAEVGVPIRISNTPNPTPTQTIPPTQT